MIIGNLKRFNNLIPFQNLKHHTNIVQYTQYNLQTHQYCNIKMNLYYIIMILYK